MAKKTAENSVVAQALKVVAAKNMGVTLDSLNNVTSVDFSQVTVPVGTVVQIPTVEEINDFLYNDKSTLNGTVYDNYGIVCPVIDTAGNIISTKRISINSLQREMPVYEMVDGEPRVANVPPMGGNTELARTLRSKEIMGDKVRFICGKKLTVTKEETVPSPRYQNGVIVGIRDRKIPVWDEFQG